MRATPSRLEVRVRRLVVDAHAAGREREVAAAVRRALAERLRASALEVSEGALAAQDSVDGGLEARLSRSLRGRGPSAAGRGE